jgi:outer membrane protein OmpA-like peptidoglycan-associated protein
VYDSTTAMTGVTLGLAGLLTNDAVTAGGAGSFSSYHVGSGLGYSINDIALSGSDAGNYYLSGTTLSGNNGLITPATLTISGITASDKVYNANTATTVSTVGAVYGGLFSGDNVTVAATGVFGDQNVGTNKVVTLSSNYTGSNVGDYAITDQASTTANITPAPLTVIGTVVANKVYDGTTAATLTGGTLSGTVYTGDSVTLATEAGNFTSPNAGTGISVTGADVLGGSSAGNYTLIQPTGLVADITSALLSNAQAGATQLISTVLSPSYAQPQSIAILPTLTITQVTSSDAEGVTDSPSGTKANEQRMSGETGATLKIENGGIKLPTIKMNPLEPSVAVEENTSNEEAMARLPIEVPEVMLVDKEKAFANALLATHQRSLPVMTVTYPVSLDDANFDNFDASSIVILSKAIPRLERVLKYASANPKANFEVSGHADKRASSKALYNMQLSERRANAVKEYLVAHGVAAERIVVKGYGFENPTADNGTKVGRAQNRRVGIRYLPAESNK